MVAARGHFPAQRERGCVQTEHAGRATPAETIESSVASLYQRTGIRKDETG